MSTTPEFVAWPKTPRLFRDMVITEKIDGTNAAIGVLDDGTVYAQSRNRIITPERDNFGFARWVHENAATLADDLGQGLHFGEWWGRGIQRGYGLDGKYFSLFNTAKWADAEESFETAELLVVPVLYAGPFATLQVIEELEALSAHGSEAAPGFMRPEGVVVYHEAARHTFKALIENDQLAKSDLA